MSKMRRIAIIAVLLGAVAVVLAIKRPPVDAPWRAPTSIDGLPMLVDLGATKCVPCKMMHPILEELREAYADTFTVQFIDVWEHPAASDHYGIRAIPTQIFFDADGIEFFRHEGFFGKDDILATWKTHGVTAPIDAQEL